MPLILLSENGLGEGGEYSARISTRSRAHSISDAEIIRGGREQPLAVSPRYSARSDTKYVIQGEERRKESGIVPRKAEAKDTREERANKGNGIATHSSVRPETYHSMVSGSGEKGVLSEKENEGSQPRGGRERSDGREGVDSNSPISDRESFDFDINIDICGAKPPLSMKPTENRLPVDKKREERVRRASVGSSKGERREDKKAGRRRKSVATTAAARKKSGDDNDDLEDDLDFIAIPERFASLTQIV